MATPGILPKARRRTDDDVLLPHNLEAERSTLGAALMSAAAADYIADTLTPDAYHRRAHGFIFEAVRELRRQNTDVDLVTIKAELGKRKKLDEVGGPAFISSLVDGVPRSTNVEHYAAILKDLQARRALVFFSNDTLNHIAAGEHSADALLMDADRRLIMLQAGHLSGRMQSLNESSDALQDDLEWRLAHRGELTGVTTGYPKIDALTLGWQPGDLIVLGARPSIGKTTFVLNALRAAAEAGKRCAIFSLEMRRKQLEYRMLASLTGVALTQILSGHVMSQDKDKLWPAINTMRGLGVEIDDTAGVSSWEIRTACRRLKAEGGLDLVVVDYVQLVPGSLERRGSTRNEEVTDISRRFKVLADEVGAPIIVLSQLSRKARDRVDPRPQLTDLRESGALEQDADIVAFLHRKNHREGGRTEFIIEKQRNGPTGAVNLWLERDVVTFTEMTPEQEALEKQAAEKKREKEAAAKETRGVRTHRRPEPGGRRVYDPT